MNGEINYYVVDTSSLIEMKTKYPFDVFPGIWQRTERLIERDLLVAPTEVLKELLPKDDSLAKWAKKNRRMFRQLDVYQIEKAREIVNEFPKIAKSDSEVAAADPFVIALAIELQESPQQILGTAVKKNIVVTEEKMRGNEIRIPLICKKYGVDCINAIELFRKEGWKLQ
jgi:hypothetical protein